MLKLHNIEEEQRIIRDCVKATQDIEKLIDKAYTFLYLSKGFISSTIHSV